MGYRHDLKGMTTQQRAIINRKDENERIRKEERERMRKERMKKIKDRLKELKEQEDKITNEIYEKVMEADKALDEYMKKNNVILEKHDVIKRDSRLEKIRTEVLDLHVELEKLEKGIL